MITTSRSQSNRFVLTIAGILCVYVANAAEGSYNYNYEGNDWKGVCATVSNRNRNLDYK